MVKEPQDHKASSKDPFVWTSPDGDRIVLTKIGRLPGGLFEDIAELPEIKQNFTLFQAATDQETYDLIRALPLDDLGDLVKAWTASSGVTLPES